MRGALMIQFLGLDLSDRLERQQHIVGIVHLYWGDPLAWAL